MGWMYSETKRIQGDSGLVILSNQVNGRPFPEVEKVLGRVSLMKEGVRD